MGWILYFKEGRMNKNKSITILQIAPLEESPNALASHYEVKFSHPVNGQWFWQLLAKAMKQYFEHLDENPDIVV